MLLQRFLVAFLITTSIGFAGTVTIEFTGLPSVFENNTYNGFAVATVDGATNQLLICDDFSHETYMPSSSLTYNYANLLGINPLQTARFESTPGSPSATEIQRYEEAAVLVWQLSAAGAGANADTVTDYQYALWNLFTPSTQLFRTNQTTLQQSAYNIVTGAAAAPSWLSSAYSELAVYTPAAGFASNQEFLTINVKTGNTQTDPQVVPEPSMAWVLTFIGGLSALLSQLRRKRS